MSSETMVGFGTKQAWLAIRDREPDVIAEPLRLRLLGDVPWRDGVDLAYLTDDRVLLTPALAGAGLRWTLLAGRWLLTPKSNVDIIALSAELDTEVQLFSSYRVGERHQWRRAVAGELIRSFAYVGETGEVTDWRGDPDPAELAVGLPLEFEEEPGLVIGEADVMRVAAAWSVDPTALAGQAAPGPLRAAAPIGS